MKVLNEKNTIDHEQWDIVGFYVVFAFKKVEHIVPDDFIGKTRQATV
jgi:hypothetical protein